jgi:hypothetical protein
MRRILLATALLACAALPTAAGLAKEAPETVVRDALDAPYGRAMLARLVAAAEKAADPACRRERGLEGAALAGGLRSFMERYAIRLVTRVNEIYDEEATAKAFAASAGADAAAEFARLERDPEVIRAQALLLPRRLASVITHTFEQLDHYITIVRLKLDHATPAARGEPNPLPEDPTAAAEEATDNFIAQSSSRRMRSSAISSSTSCSIRRAPAA